MVSNTDLSILIALATIMNVVFGVVNTSMINDAINEQIQPTTQVNPINEKLLDELMVCTKGG